MLYRQWGVSQGHMSLPVCLIEMHSLMILFWRAHLPCLVLRLSALPYNFHRLFVFEMQYCNKIQTFLSSDFFLCRPYSHWSGDVTTYWSVAQCTRQAELNSSDISEHGSANLQHSNVMWAVPAYSRFHRKKSKSKGLIQLECKFYFAKYWLKAISP